jgi:hypothetical protein
MAYECGGNLLGLNINMQKSHYQTCLQGIVALQLKPALNSDDLLPEKSGLFLDCAELANRTIHWANKVRLGYWARISFKWASKKRVKASVACNVRICRLSHIHLVTLCEPSNNGSR